jgi:glycerol uptake facilitator-like aquaporin
VLITMLGPISGAHVNPAVTAAFVLRRDLGLREGLAYCGAQIAGGLAGVIAAHLMFDERVFQLSLKLRDGPAQLFSEWVATFGLVLTILLTLRARPAAVPVAVGLYITAAYWFTASTSFANPAVTLARGFSDTFAGIRPEDVPGFIAAQFAGAVSALLVCRLLLGREDTAVTAAPSAARAPSEVTTA